MAAEKPRVILAPVVDVSQRAARADGVESAIDTALKTALFNSGNFVLVADQELRKSLDAEKYAQYLSGDFNPSQAAAIGQKVGAQSMVICKIVTNSYETKKRDRILYTETEYTMNLAVSVEICNIESATVLFMYTAQSQKSSSSKQLDSASGGSPISLGNAKDVRSQAINEVVADLAEKINSNAVKIRGKGNIVSVKNGGLAGDSIVVDIGAGMGAETGMEVCVLGVDEDGFEEQIGSAKITAVQEDKAKATIVKTSRALKTGDRVQLAASAGSDRDNQTNNIDGPWAGKRVMVALPETHLRLIVPDPAAETEIINSLTKNRFVVVDQKISQELWAEEKNRALLAGDAEKVLALLRDKTSAEILIYGEAFSEGVQSISTDSGPAFRCVARVEVRAVNMDNGRVIYADGQQATATDATESTAGKRALKTAAELLLKGREGKKGFVEILKEKIANPGEQYLEIWVGGIDDVDDLPKVEEALKSAAGGARVNRYSFRDGIAKISVETSMTAQDFTNAVGKVSVEGGKLKLASSTAQKIDLTLQK